MRWQHRWPLFIRTAEPHLTNGWSQNQHQGPKSFSLRKLFLLPSLAPSSTVLPLQKYRAFEHSSLTRPLYFLKHFKRKKEKQTKSCCQTEKQRKLHRESRDDFCTFMAELKCRSHLFSLTSNFSGCHISSLRSTRRTEENGTESDSFVCNDRNSGDPRIHSPPQKKDVPYDTFFFSFKLQIHWVVMAT